MSQFHDARAQICAMHMQSTADLMQLMEGFFSNIEDGLFELAFREKDRERQRQSVELMRELRSRRTQLLNSFGKKLRGAQKDWFTETQTPDGDRWAVAVRMASKSEGHFGPLLERMALAVRDDSGETAETVESGETGEWVNLPLSPRKVAYLFVTSCGNFESDPQVLAFVNELFSRFVLDRLGGVYAQFLEGFEADCLKAQSA